MSWTPRTISSIYSNPTLIESDVFRGRIISKIPYNPSSRIFQFTIESIDDDPRGCQLDVELRCLEILLNKINVDETIVCLAKEKPKVIRYNKSTNDHVERIKVVYEKSFSGWIVRKNGDEERLTNYNQVVTKMSKRPRTPLIERVSNLDEEVSKANFQDLSRLIPPPERRAKSNQLLVNDEDNSGNGGVWMDLDNLEEETTTSVDQDSTDQLQKKKVSPPGQGTRSIKKRKKEAKLVEMEAGLIWGLKINDGPVYTPLDQIVNDDTGVGSSRNVVVIIVNERRIPSSPDHPKKDYYLKLEITDPTLDYNSLCTSVNPLPTSTIPTSKMTKTMELQWYSKEESKCPVLNRGDVLIVRGLNVGKGKNGILLKKPSWSKCPYFIIPSTYFSSNDQAQNDNVNVSTKKKNDSCSTSRSTSKPSLPSPPTTLLLPLRFIYSKSTTIKVDPREIEYAKQVGMYYTRHRLLVVEEEERGEDVVSMSNRSVPSTIQQQSSSVSRVGQIGTGTRNSGRPLNEIKDISPGEFCDLIAEIVKIYVPTGYSITSPTKIPSHLAVQLFVTDYSTNDLLMSHDEHNDDKIPTGQRTLQVSLFGYQSEPLHQLLQPTNTTTNVKGGFSTTKVIESNRFLIHLRNLRPKENSKGLLEATLVEDSNERFRDRRDLRVLNVGRNQSPDWWKGNVMYGEKIKRLYE